MRSAVYGQSLVWNAGARQLWPMANPIIGLDSVDKRFN
jgi:hypothetical protein